MNASQVALHMSAEEVKAAASSCYYVAGAYVICTALLIWQLVLHWQTGGVAVSILLFWSPMVIYR